MAKQFILKFFVVFLSSMFACRHTNMDSGAALDSSPNSLFSKEKAALLYANCNVDVTVNGTQLREAKIKVIKSQKKLFGLGSSSCKEVYALQLNNGCAESRPSPGSGLPNCTTYNRLTPKIIESCRSYLDKNIIKVDSDIDQNKSGYLFTHYSLHKFKGKILAAYHEDTNICGQNKNQIIEEVEKSCDPSNLISTQSYETEKIERETAIAHTTYKINKTEYIYTCKE